jgi:hypothetical protein
MQHLGKWVAGTLGGVLAIAVLFYAANAKSAGTYNSALLIFVVLLVFVFAQIKRGFDQEDRKRKSDEAPDDPDKAAAAGGAGAGKSGAAKTAGSTSGSAQASASKATSSKSSGSKAAAAKSGAAQSGAAQSGGTTQARSPAGPTNGSSAKH